MSDLIRLLLQAEIDTRSSLDKINKQIKEIEKQSRKIKLDINLGGDASKAISDINRTIAQTTKVTDTATKSNKKHNKSVYKLIHLYRTQQMSTEEFIKSASKYREASKFKMLSDKQQKQLMTQLISAEKEHTRVLNEAAKVKSRIVNEMADGREKANQRRIASEKKWEEAQSRATNKALEDNYRLQQQVEQFQQKMLGTSDFRGQVDIFAQKNRGRINIGEVTKFREEIENLSKLPIEQQSQAMQRLKNQFSAIRSEASQSSSVIARTFENAFKFLRFYLVGGVLTGFVRDMRRSIRFVEELDKELTQISIITRMTKDETLDLARSYGELGKEMGKTVTEISKVNTELVRQGLSVDESAKRLDTILKLSATGAISTDQSLKIITSAVNALGEESERTADVMLKSSQISASSVEEIGNAFTKTASSAKSTGMTLTELNSIISGLIEVTQESPSSLGNSVKTLLGRFNRINEETGELNESFNDVQDAFESVNITFLDSEKQIRPVYELLVDLDKIWGSLDKNTKMYIATQAAGVRQQNRFLAIMDNFSRIQEINNELMESGGTLVEGYATYLNSVEAASNKAKASLENLWVNAI
ncbi:MAG TPA: phage tail tape measure protein, partial [Bacteroidales bacterium]|nr:phage tail tape measure protein [Bacteroidales bacterium]